MLLVCIFNHLCPSFQHVHYLNVAGCGGVVGSAGQGGVGDGVVLEGGQ